MLCATKSEFATTVAEGIEANAKAAVAATTQEQVSIPTRTSSRRKPKPVDLTMPFANGEDSPPSGPVFDRLKRRYDERGIEVGTLLRLKFQKDEQEAELAKARDARDQEDSDVYDDAGAKFLGLGKIKARVPYIVIPAISRKGQKSAILSGPTRLEELQATVALISLPKLFTSGRAIPPKLSTDEPIAETLQISVDELYRPSTPRAFRANQEVEQMLWMDAERELARCKAQEAESEKARQLAAHKWAETNDTLDQTAEKHKTRKK